VHRYSRADLLRILRLTARQLAAWEKAELVAVTESYSFFDLLQIKKVRDLCAHKVRPAVIRQSLQAMQKQAAGMENPLLEASAFSTGDRIAFRHEGRVVEPIAGQFMFDFSSRDNVLASTTPVIRPVPADVAGLFAQGIALEEDPNTQVQARPHTSTWARCITTGRITHCQSGTIARPLQSIRVMPWLISIWEMCWMKPAA
jgi:hypothetical protein